MPGGCVTVGARGKGSQSNALRWMANRFYNWLASWVCSHKILDLTSGFRAIRADLLRDFLHLLPNGFSYPTTITMAFFRSGYDVAYLPITASRRAGKSHIRAWKDGLRFLLIIFRIGTLYSPLKIFFPVAVAHGALGVSYYLYTYLNDGRFTNMGVTLFVAAISIFLIGLVSEQITSLIYSRGSER